MIVVLDNIRSCHNVGSIFRTADGAGVEEILLCGYTPGPLTKYGFENNKLTKVSLGAEKSVKWRHFEKTEDAINWLLENGYDCVGIEQTEDSIDVNSDISINLDKVAFVFGNEKEGVSSQVLNLCSRKLEVPMHGHKRSLNVSVTVGIVLFYFVLTA